MSSTPSATPTPPSRRPTWLLPVFLAFFVVTAWTLYRRGEKPAVAPGTAAPVATTEGIAPSVTRSLPATGLGAARPVAELSAAPEVDPPAEPLTITPELRAEREALFQQLTELQDPTLAAVKSAFAAAGIDQSAGVASGWVLAQHWGIFARAEAMVDAKVTDEKMRQELAVVRRRILILSAEGEVRGLLDRNVDSRLFAEVEAIGRGLKDNAPPPPELLPTRAPANAQRGLRRPRGELPPEE